MSVPEPTGGAPARLDKALGLADVYAISTGAMFSSGFFLLPGLAAAQTGPSVSLAYLVAGLFIMPAMFSVAELATAMPKAGGAYYFLDRALGPMVGTIGGLGTWVALVLKTAFALVGMGAYLALYFDVPIQPLAITLTAVFVVINVLGAKETSGLQRVLVGALLVILGFFILQGLLEVSGRGFDSVAAERFTPFFAFGFSGFMATVGFVFVSYAGLTKVASVAEEVTHPERNIPLGMMLSLATAALVYSVGVYILVALVPAGQLREDLTPVATAAGELFAWLPPGAGVLLMVVAATAAFASTGNAGVLSASRYPLAMARDRLVPDVFARLGRFNTPTYCILATGLLIGGCIVLLDVEGIAKLASAFQLLLFSLLSLAVMVMRGADIDGYDPGFRSPLYPWMQIVGVLTPLWLIAEMGEIAVLFTLGLSAATAGWYFLYAEPRVVRSGAIFHAFARMGERRYGGLDMELRAIVAEKGLRAEDPFDEVVARAEVRDVSEAVTFGDLVEIASASLGHASGVPTHELSAGFLAEYEAGFMPLAKGAALPHLKIPGLERPVFLIVRCSAGLLRMSDEPEEMVEELGRLRAVFFLVSPREAPAQHLRLLGHLATHVEDPTFLKSWAAARTEDELRETLLREERSFTLHLEQGAASGSWIGRPIREIDLPKSALVALIRRDGQGIIPHGDDVLKNGDHLTVIGDPAAIDELVNVYGRSRGESSES